MPWQKLNIWIGNPRYIQHSTNLNALFQIHMRLEEPIHNSDNQNPCNKIIEFTTAKLKSLKKKMEFDMV